MVCIPDFLTLHTCLNFVHEHLADNETKFN